MRRPMFLAATAAGAAAAAVLWGCKMPTCVATETPYAYGVDLAATAGPRSGLPVAHFDVVQNFVTHAPIGCDGAPTQDVGAVTLSITSTAPVAQYFLYSVQGLNAVGPVWAYEDTVKSIAPGQTLTVQRIAVSPLKLTFGARVLLKDVTPLP
jgi:hypothetical protein